MQLLADSPIMMHELNELLSFNLERIDFIDQPVPLGFDCPLHCTYTRDQILIAMDHMTPKNVRKVSNGRQTSRSMCSLSRSTRRTRTTPRLPCNNDYSINESLFHWQSQSTTSDTASTGQRYINHRQRGSKVVSLLCREFKQDSIGAAPYTCLGTAAYVKHTGNKPMNITWHLDRRFRRSIFARRTSW